MNIQRKRKISMAETKQFTSWKRSRNRYSLQACILAKYGIKFADAYLKVFSKYF